MSNEWLAQTRAKDYLAVRNSSSKEWFVVQWLLELLALSIVSTIAITPLNEELVDLGKSLFGEPALAATVILAVCLAVQLALGISVVRGLYCALISFALSTASPFMYVFLLLLLASLFLECVRTSERCFAAVDCLTAECNNFLKALHFLSVSVLVALYTVLGHRLVWLNCAVLAVAISLLALRLWTRAFSVYYQCLSEMTYLPLVVGALLNLTASDGTLSVPTVLLVHAAAALLYAGVRSLVRRTISDYEELVKRNTVLEQFEQHLYDLSQEVLNPEYCADVAELVSDFDPTVSSKDVPNFETRDQFRLALLNQIDKLYHDSSDSSYLLLRAYGCYHVRKDCIGTLRTLRQLQTSLCWYNVEWRLMLYRLRREVQRELQFRWRQQEGLDKHFHEHQAFLELLVHSSDCYRLWWEALAESSTVHSTLESLGRRLVECRRLVAPAYAGVWQKTRELVNTYAHYLYFVERDLQPLPGLIMQGEFYGSIHLEYQWCNSLFLELNADPASFGELLRVGPNSLALIGVPSSRLVGESMSELIPDFFRSHHDSIISTALEKGATLDHLPMSVLVQDDKGNYRDAILRLSIWSTQIVTSFCGSLTFSSNRQQQSCVTFNESTGEILGGSELINLRLNYTVQTLSGSNLDQILTRLASNQSIALSVEGKILLDNCTLLRKIKYDGKVAVVMVSTPSSKYSRSMTVGAPSVFSTHPFVLKENSSIWTYLDNKERRLGSEYSWWRLAIQLALLWFLSFGFICCSSANFILEYNNAAAKNANVQMLYNLNGQEIGVYDMLIWNRQMRYFQLLNVTFPTVSYTSLDEIKRKATGLSKFLSTNNIEDQVIAELVYNTTFNNDNSIFLESMSSAMELIVQYFHNPNPSMQRIVRQVTNYVMRNWREVSTTAVNQVKNSFYSNYLKQKDTFSISIMILFITKCGASLGLALLLILYDRHRSTRQTKTLSCLLDISDEDSKMGVYHVDMFRLHLAGAPFERDDNKKNLTFEPSSSSRKRSYFSNLGNDTLASLTMNITSISENPSSIATSNRMRLPTTVVTEGDNPEEPIIRKRIAVNKTRPNVIFIALVVLVSCSCIAVSATSYAQTFSVGYFLKDYIDNFFFLQTKMSSFTRLTLSILADLDPSDPSANTFAEMIQRYNDSLRSNFTFNPTIMMFDEFNAFNTYKNNVDMSPVCNYTACLHYSDMFNITLDNSLNQRVLWMIQASQSGVASADILASVDMQYLNEMLSLLFQLTRQELQLYTDNLKTHVMEVLQRQINLFSYELACLFVLLICLILPFTLLLMRWRVADIDLMNVIDRKSYMKDISQSQRLSNVSRIS